MFFITKSELLGFTLSPSSGDAGMCSIQGTTGESDPAICTIISRPHLSLIFLVILIYVKVSLMR